MHSLVPAAQSNVAQQGTIIGTPKNKTKLMMAWSEGGVAWCDVGRGRSARQQVIKQASSLRFTEMLDDASREDSRLLPEWLDRMDLVINPTLG